MNATYLTCALCGKKVREDKCLVIGDETLCTRKKQGEVVPPCWKASREKQRLKPPGALKKMV